MRNLNNNKNKNHKIYDDDAIECVINQEKQKKNKLIIIYLRIKSNKNSIWLLLNFINETYSQ